MAQTALKLLLRICTDLAGVQSVCLYDTGSSYSILSDVHYHELIENLNYSGQKQYNRYLGKVPVFACKNVLKILGEVKMPVTFGSVTRVVHFLIAENVSEPSWEPDSFEHPFSLATL